MKFTWNMSPWALDRASEGIEKGVCIYGIVFGFLSLCSLINASLPPSPATPNPSVLLGVRLWSSYLSLGSVRLALPLAPLL